MQVAAKYGDQAPMAAVCCNACRTCTTTNLGVAVDADVPTALEDHLEVVPVDGLVRPPAIDDAPLLPHERHLLTIHDVRGSSGRGLEERRARRV